MTFPLFHRTTISASIWGLLFAALLLLDVGLRFARCTQLEYQPRDTYAYVESAEILARAEHMPIFDNPVENKERLSKLPLLVCVMAAGEKFGVGAQRTGLIFVFLCGVLIPVVLAGIAHELFGDWRYTLGTMLLASVMPPLVRHSVLVLRDMPYWFFCASAVWLAVRAERKHCLGYWFGFAAVAVLAACTRREGMELILAWGLWLFCSGWNRQEFRRQLRQKCEIACCVLVPYLTLALFVQKIWNDCGSSWQLLPLKSLGYYWSRLI